MDQRELVERIDRLEREIAMLKEGRTVGYFTANSPFTKFTTPLTSSSWDGDSHSTTAKTLIDVSATFTNAAGETVPDGVKALLLRLAARDSASASATPAATTTLIVGPNDTTGAGMYCDCSGLPNDIFVQETVIVPCNDDGNIYYQIIASGAGTLDAYIQVYGYWK